MNRRKEMNKDLNSILLEGKIRDKPVLAETKAGTPFTEMTVISTGYYSQNGERVREDSTFIVHALSKLAKTCCEYLKAGRGVRVVGRLKQTETGGVVIIAEHVEIKPEMAKKEEEQAEEVSL
jgi:single-strand DNA-binding protein